MLTCSNGVQLRNPCCVLSPDTTEINWYLLELFGEAFVQADTGRSKYRHIVPG